LLHRGERARRPSRFATRGFGGFLVFAAALTLLAAGPGAARASSEAILASSETVIGLSLERVSTGKESLAIRGASTASDMSQFDAVATLARVPCPGPYRYQLQSENQQTGALSSYTARVYLAPFPSDQAPPCGAVPPPRPGTLHVSIPGNEEGMDFEQGTRSGSGGFFGVFTLWSLPEECGRRYAFAVDVDLRGWDRSVRYQLKVMSFESRAQGQLLAGEPEC
jgi:hypothetical protein